MSKQKVYILKSDDRNDLAKLMNYFNIDSWNGSKIALKANYNSSDPFPASTHPETLKNIIINLKSAGVDEITLAERSGMGDTRSVLKNRGVFSLSEELNFKVVVLNEEKVDSWLKISGKNNHWLRGFYLPKLVFDADKVVQTCCLKTHRFGGQFTLSLKNSIGWVAKRIPGGLYDYMAELHISPSQRKMIAEVNKYFNSDLIIMDAIKGFVSQGPDKGRLVEPGLILASSNRVAMDTVGVALLRLYGASGSVSKGPIFEQDQLKRAVELNLGVSSVEDIELIAVTEDSVSKTAEIQNLLDKKG